jgi:DNA-binding FrmR family transcriptional regulator
MAITGETKKQISTRLSKAIGHLNAVQTMVRDEKYCIDILNQMKAVQAALDKTAQLMLKQHLNTCVVEAVKTNDSERVMNELWQLLKKGSDENSEDVSETSLQESSCCKENH